PDNNLRKRKILRRDEAQSEDISGSILKYVTGVAERWQRGHDVKDSFRAQRICLAALARWSHLTPCRTQK
ncbi:hypothetical protein C5L22_22155, partial [Pantoea ananatis]